MANNRIGEAVLALDENVIETLRTRRSAGESLAKLAAEIGVSWQRLWTMLSGTGGLL